jgi:Ca2+-binding EF-hand superfamily protein
MDVDGNGAISKKEFSDAAAKSGFNITEEQVEEIFTEVDLDHNGKVDFLEFKKVLN